MGELVRDHLVGLLLVLDHLLDQVNLPFQLELLLGAARVSS